MKWGRKKSHHPSSPSSSSSTFRPSLISHVFPISWLSKFKLIGDQKMSKPGKVNPKAKRNFDSPSYGGRFYSGDDSDSFSRLSFGEGDHEDQNFNDMVCGIRKQRELPFQVKKVTPNSDKLRRGNEIDLKSPRKGNGKRLKLRKIESKPNPPREFEVSEEEADGSTIKKSEIDMRKSKNLRENSNSNSIESKKSDIGSKWERKKVLKLEEVKLRNEKQRKSLHIRPNSSRKLKIHSPRMAACKVNPKQTMITDENADFASFAVVKYSVDPQKDFKESMVEMIREKRIRRGEDMEELLACYLTLNSDEYHDLIIKVFRQVWFGMVRS